MKTLKLFIFAVLSFGLLINCASAQNNRGETKSQTVKPGKIRETKPPQRESGEQIKMLVAGSHSIVETPFVFVARTPESFTQLRKLVENLPPEKIDFSKTAVVAAFAGEKNTGGYSVNIEKNAGKISVNVAAPPKDAFVTQVLTTPYAVALVAIEPGNGLNLALSADFSKVVKNYRVASGEFKFSGGIAGIQKNFRSAGVIRILSFGDFITLMFDLTGTAGESPRKLNETASGVIERGKITFARIESGSFIDGPHTPFAASGIFSAEKLSLSFEPGKTEYVVRDGFSGSGKIQAIKIK